MRHRSLAFHNALVGMMVAGAVAAACSHSNGSTFDNNKADAAAGGAGGVLVGGGGSANNAAGIAIVASSPTITVAYGATSPTVTITATVQGQSMGVNWSVDRGDAATISSGTTATAVFTPTGAVGGLVTVTAAYNGSTVTTQIFIKLTSASNGVPTGAAAATDAAQTATSIGQLTAGGGVGGVGGEGLGQPVSADDTATLTALATPSSNGSAQNLRFLYPYDKTVFPRGMLAPLLQWDWSTGDADAIQITLSTTSGSFAWTGTYSKPAILAQLKGTTALNDPNQVAGDFTRHPIPQDVWNAATNTAGGATASGAPDQLTVGLTVVKGGVGYGPLQQTWTIAPGRLSGTIYYQSYGTKLAKNSGGAVGGDGTFGGAVLSIKVGDTGPALAAGSNNECRICHSVASEGAALVTQRGENYTATSEYAITPSGLVETAMPVPNNASQNTMVYPALYPNGSMALRPDGTLVNLPAGDTAMAGGAGVSGMAAVSTSLGTPAFSPDGTQVVINPQGTTGDYNFKKLVVMAFDKTTLAFSKPTIVADFSSSSSYDVGPGWAAFLPDGKSVAFEQQLLGGLASNRAAFTTWQGAQGVIAWTNTTDANHVTRLNALNGFAPDGTTSTLPTLATPSNVACSSNGTAFGAGAGTQAEFAGPNLSHENDVNLNFEPTVNPVASGGYAWVVFTSRRMYGSVAAIPPYCSDPRDLDLTKNITSKKLWVAAVDVNAAPGADASHPAFYLPAQEILAGNARAFWVLDPCRSNGASCETGDECCGGYCQANGTDGALTCSDVVPNGCAATGNKCAAASDCCNPSDACINGFCSLASPK